MTVARPNLEAQRLRALQVLMQLNQNGKCHNMRNSDGTVIIDFYATSHADVMLAKNICAMCPVIDECRTHALHHEMFGVWGGTSERERIRLRVSERIKFVDIYASVNPISRSSREKVAVKGDIMHGTRAGYRRETTTLGVEPCDECREAHRLWMQKQRARKAGVGGV